MARNASKKFVADWAGLVAGIATAVITARVLGADGRGVFATVAFVAGFAGSFAVLGLGESVIIAVGRARTSVEAGIRTALSVVVGSSLLLGAVTWLAAVALIPEGMNATMAATWVSLGVVTGALTTLFSYGLNARHQFTVPILVVAAVPAATAVLLAVFLLVLDQGLVGAFAALALGSLVGLAAVAVRARREGLLGFGFERSLFRELLPNGLRLALSGTVMTLTARLDLLLVFLLASEAAAGRYSIALTVGGLAATAGAAIAYASFPRLSYAKGSEWLQLADKVVQTTLVATVVGALALALTSPLLIPLLFGSEFEAAVVPTLILLVGAGFASLQWVLSRVSSAQGHPGIALRAYAVSSVVMVVGDLALIPPFGIEGAAVAASISGLAGAAVALHGIRALGSPYEDLPVRPRARSFLELPAMIRATLRRRRESIPPESVAKAEPMEGSGLPSAMADPQEPSSSP